MNLTEFEKKLRAETGFEAAFTELDDDVAFQTSQLIEGLRISESLTQSAFAKRIGSHQSAVARFERGRIAPSLPILQKMAKAFNRRLVVAFLPESVRFGLSPFMRMDKSGYELQNIARSDATSNLKTVCASVEGVAVPTGWSVGTEQKA
ncbi:MAG: helix-turn-helix transcriptional regulator [Patescibacteria group bacterium]